MSFSCFNPGSHPTQNKIQSPRKSTQVPAVQPCLPVYQHLPLSMHLATLFFFQILKHRARPYGAFYNVKNQAFPVDGAFCELKKVPLFLGRCSPRTGHVTWWVALGWTPAPRQGALASLSHTEWPCWNYLVSSHLRALLPAVAS